MRIDKRRRKGIPPAVIFRTASRDRSVEAHEIPREPGARERPLRCFARSIAEFTAQTNIADHARERRGQLVRITGTMN